MLLVDEVQWALKVQEAKASMVLEVSCCMHASGYLLCVALLLCRSLDSSKYGKFRSSSSLKSY